MPITISEAQTIIDGAIAKAKELNVKVTVAVVDGGGKIVAVNKMDGAHWAGTYGAIGKAVGASAFGRPTGEMQDQAFSPTPSGVRERSGGEMILGQGGIPINRDGFIEGGCGVGGSIPPQDEECARAGVVSLMGDDYVQSIYD